MRRLKRRKNDPMPASLPVLQTERLVLRGFDSSDAVDVFAYAQSPNVGPMAGWAAHASIEESRAVVEMFIHDGDVWAVVDKKTGRVIGSIGLHLDKQRAVVGARELGFALGEANWGQGFATEACKVVIAYAFEGLQCPVLSVGHFPANQKSKHVIKKLGFVFEGTFRHAFTLPDGAVTDDCRYSMLRAEYEAQKTSKNQSK